MARVLILMVWMMALGCAIARPVVVLAAQEEFAAQSDAPQWRAGSVVEVRAVELLDVADNPPVSAWSGWLSNGVRAHAMPLQTERGRAVLRVHLAGNGEVVPPSADVAAVALITEMHQADTKAGKLLAASGWRLWAQSGRRGLVINLEGPSEAMPQAVQAVAMGLADPRWAAGGFSRWRERTRAALEANGSDMTHALNLAIDQAMGLPEPKPPVLDGEDALTEQDVQRWLRKRAGKGGMAVAVVGDIDRAQTMELLGIWFGGLDARPRVTPTLPEAWTIQPTHRRVPVNGQSSAVVFRGIAGPLTERLDEARIMRQTTLVLDQRLGKALREAGLEAAGARSGMLFGDQHSGRCMLWLTGSVASENTDKAMQVFEIVLADVAARPADEQEMSELNRQTVALLNHQLIASAYWADRLVSADTTGIPLLSASALRKAYDSITAEAISGVLREHLLDAHRIDLVVGPGAQADTVPETYPESETDTASGAD